MPNTNVFYECASSLNISILWRFNVGVKVFESTGINPWANVCLRRLKLSKVDEILHLCMVAQECHMDF